MMRTADGQPIAMDQIVYAESQNLNGISTGRVGVVVGLEPGKFYGGIVLVHWNGSRLVPRNIRANIHGYHAVEMVSFDIGTQAMRPSELLSGPKELRRLV